MIGLIAQGYKEKVLCRKSLALLIGPILSGYVCATVMKKEVKHKGFLK